MASQLPDGLAMPLNGALPSTVGVGALGKTMSAYVHIPFCRVRCGYCDFNTYTATELRGVSRASYVEELKKEIALSIDVLQRADVSLRPLHTVFFGGGTPTLLPVSDLADALQALRDSHGIEPEAEITVEANPDTLTAEYVDGLVRAGFTRVSVGMQSAVPHVLSALDRTHNPAAVDQAVSTIHSAGLEASIDLIYGAPGESLADWRRSLEQAISLNTGHISAYALIVEDGTALARKIGSGAMDAPDDDLQAEMYELADELLSKAGFQWYEISNWAKSQQQHSQHNLAYWNNQDWWGYGPGAHSAIGGTRFWNVKHPAAYAGRLAEAHSPALSYETPDQQAVTLEQVLLGSRLAAGIPTQGHDPQAISTLIAWGLIDGKRAIEGRIELTLSGRLRADEVVRELLFRSQD
ncbi:radical SAM family heme chaperone HemW [Aurantimicrobium minutum]|uniref:radical SAM family heme chaperone HemW n=1 Tax=Aurantimicrobium minutum TaxID=708131 RepID=UPI002476ABFA|nr:radical SAM family heme chaperone HemW [Aurantimicrobium minutum]MDH6239466.1 putative oxygen-independent coproporphyrinogen III oxidase [Aurantimicrobium minutum]